MRLMAVNRVNTTDSQDDKDAPSSIVVDNTVMPHSDEFGDRTTAVLAQCLFLLFDGARILDMD